MCIYDNNLELLKGKNEYLYEKVKNLRVNQKVYDLVKAKNGSYTVKVGFCDDIKKVEFFIHSKYDPVKEAENFADAQFRTKAGINILYGFGMGYHVGKILEKLDDDILYVVDLNTEIFKLAMEANDISAILSDKRIELIISDDEKFIAGALKGLLVEENKLCLYTPSVKAIPPQFEKFRLILEDWNIKKSLSDKWVDLLGSNYNENKKVKCRNINVLFNKFRGQPVIIVSSGPSLNSNKHLLSLLKGKALIFAAGSAVKPLMKSGIKPDMFCIIDPQPVTYKQIEGYEDMDMPLVFLDTASSFTVSRYNGPKYRACNDPSHAEAGDCLIESGGSVATAVMDMAIKLGGNPIVFVGQDLAYTENKHHAMGDMYGGSTEKKSLPNMRKVKGQNGEILNTSLGLLSFKHWIENKIKDNRQIRFINATEGGAYIEGCRHMSLKEFIIEQTGNSLEPGELELQIEINGKISLYQEELKDCDSNTAFVFMGLGDMDRIIAISRLATPNNKVMLMEPEEELCKGIQNSSAFREFLSRDNILLIKGQDKEAYQAAITGSIGLEQYNNVKVYRSYADTSPYDVYFKGIELFLETRLEQVKMHINTIKRLEDSICRNVYDNLPYMAGACSISDIRDMCKNAPAIIVSAGPSLEKNIDVLKNADGKAVVIAGVRTVKPLLDRGITPQFVVNIDPNDVAYELTGGINTAIPLITLLHGNGKVVAANNGTKVFIGDPAYSPFIEKVTGKSFDPADAGGSVANASTSIAYEMGCDPIIFIGQDLAFTNEKRHSDIAAIDREKNHVENLKMKLLEVEDNNGGKIKTNYALFYFLGWFEDFIVKHGDRTFINATEGGARIKGARTMTLEEAVEKYCRYNERCRKAFDIPGDGINGKRQAAEVIAGLKETYSNLCMMESYFGINKGLAEELCDYYTGKAAGDLNAILTQMDETDRKLKAYEAENSLMHYPMQLPSLYISQNYSQRLFETNAEANKRISEKNVKLYDEKQKAVKKTKIYIEKTLKKLESIT